MSIDRTLSDVPEIIPTVRVTRVDPLMPGEILHMTSLGDTQMDCSQTVEPARTCMLDPCAFSAVKSRASDSGSSTASRLAVGMFAGTRPCSFGAPYEKAAHKE
eukprot:2453893-Rhodomonas_salina.3